MVEQYVQQLQEDPARVASKLAIHLGVGAVPETKVSGTFTKHGIDDVSLVTCESSSELFIDYDLSSENADDSLNIGISDTGKGPRVYYLPWGPHTAHRISLDQMPPRSFFFTAQLDGCAIAIEGSVETPTVYHLNANNCQKEHSPLSDHKMREDLALDVLKERNKVMFESFNEFSADAAAKGTGAVTPLEYGVLIGRQSESLEVDALIKNNAARKDVVPQFVESNGCVFGIRTDAGWKFFVQKRVYLVEKKYLVLRYAEFWPNGFHRPLNVPG